MATQNTITERPKAVNTEESRLKVLTEVASSGQDVRIEPVISHETRIGYYYPEICSILGCDPGDELDLLDSLTEVGCLTKELYDKIDLCPYCLDSNLRLRKLCPYCRSSLIVIKEVLHHFRCGWVGIEDEAKQGTDLVCPKCKKQLRHVGVDYERASQSFYCTTCKKIFAQPLEEFLSIPCGRQIPKDGTMVQPIYVYALTQLGEQAARKRSFEDLPLQRGIIENDLNLYTGSYVERRMAELVNRYLRYRAGFSAALISIDQYERWVADKGHVKASEAVKLLASVLKGETRGVDLPGHLEDATFILLLPQTNHRGATAFARRFVERISGISDPNLDEVPSVSVAIAGCPEDGEDGSSIMTKLRQRLQACQAQGGNCIESQ